MYNLKPAGSQLTFLLSLTDGDECKLEENICGSHSTCKNTIGSYQCVCDDGFIWNENKCLGKLIFIKSKIINSV